MLNAWVLKPTQGTFFHSHFNDVLAGAIILAFANAIAPADSRAARFVSSLKGSALIIAFAILVWEGLGSWFRTGARADPLDAAAYVIGAAIYLAVAGLERRRSGSTQAG